MRIASAVPLGTVRQNPKAFAFAGKAEAALAPLPEDTLKWVKTLAPDEGAHYDTLLKQHDEVAPEDPELQTKLDVATAQLTARQADHAATEGRIAELEKLLAGRKAAQSFLSGKSTAVDDKLRDFLGAEMLADLLSPAVTTGDVPFPETHDPEIAEMEDRLRGLETQKAKATNEARQLQETVESATAQKAALAAVRSVVQEKLGGLQAKLLGVFDRFRQPLAVVEATVQTETAKLAQLREDEKIWQDLGYGQTVKTYEGQKALHHAFSEASDGLGNITESSLIPHAQDSPTVQRLKAQFRGAIQLIVTHSPALQHYLDDHAAPYKEAIANRPDIASAEDSLTKAVAQREQLLTEAQTTLKTDTQKSQAPKGEASVVKQNGTVASPPANSVNGTAYPPEDMATVPTDVETEFTDGLANIAMYRTDPEVIQTAKELHDLEALAAERPHDGALADRVFTHQCLLRQLATDDMQSEVTRLAGLVDQYPALQTRFNPQHLMQIYSNGMAPKPPENGDHATTNGKPASVEIPKTLEALKLAMVPGRIDQNLEMIIGFLQGSAQMSHNNKVAEFLELAGVQVEASSTTTFTHRLSIAGGHSKVSLKRGSFSKAQTILMLKRLMLDAKVVSTAGGATA